MLHIPFELPEETQEAMHVFGYVQTPLNQLLLSGLNW